VRGDRESPLGAEAASGLIDDLCRAQFEGVVLVCVPSGVGSL
jgi:hypothetical protein